jgi:hypothetical protein
MTEEDVNRLARILERRGGTVTVQDPRVDLVRTWLIGMVGTAIVGSMLWLANSVDSLNRNFAGMAAWKEYVDQRLENLERRQ